MELISPSREQLALALAIVKSKPANLDIKDYILQVRQFIKTSRDPEVFHSPEKFFDSVAFWKQAHDKSEVEQSKLRDRIYELEQYNEMLLARILSQAKGLEKTVAPESSKKRRVEDPTSRARTQLYPTFGMFDSGSQDLDIVVSSPFMRQFYVLQKALQRRSDIASIVRPAVDLCKRCADAIEEAAPTEPNRNGARSKDAILMRAKLSRLKATLQAVESAVNLLLQALKKISASEPTGRDANILTYHVVSLYETIMNTLGRYSRIWASIRPSSITLKFSTQGPITRSKTSAGVEALLEIEKEGAMLFTSLLSGMITALDAKQAEQQNLIEGFLCILLSRVGKLLCIFNFRDLQLRPELRVDPSILPPPAGLIDTELDDQSLDAMCTEAKHLVWLLQRALTAFDTCFSALDSEAEGDSSRSQFISSIRTKLENTLVQAVFGANPDLGLCLERPALPENLNIDRFLRSQKVPQLSVPDWYISEVWSLMGWRVLVSLNNS